MPGQHDKKKHQIAVKFPHPVWRQVEKAAAAENGKDPSQFIRDVVTLRVANVELDANDAQIIADRIAAAEREGRMK